MQIVPLRFLSYRYKKERSVFSHVCQLTACTCVLVMAECAGCCAFWCPPCYWCKLSSRMDEYYCGPSVFPCGFHDLFRVGMRAKLRTMYGIRVSHIHRFTSTLIYTNNT